jgi:hypothetical protein
MTIEIIKEEYEDMEGGKIIEIIREYKEDFAEIDKIERFKR